MDIYVLMLIIINIILGLAIFLFVCKLFLNFINGVCCQIRDFISENEDFFSILFLTLFGI